MSTVLAAIDGSVYSRSVGDHAAWAAARLGAPVELMQVLGRRDLAAEDRSGRLAPGARRQLLEELAALDAERNKLLMKQARLELDDAAAAIARDGMTVAATLRHGDLLETLAEREETAALIVVGKRGQAADFAKLHLGSNLERILRGARRPVLIASRAFKPISRFMIAFDGRPSALKTIDAASRSPLFQGLRGVVVTATDAPAAAAPGLEAAAAQLRAGGLEVETMTAPGPAATAIPAAVAREGVDLLAMGAYGHSSLRTLLIGSTTSEVIRGSLVPVLVYR